MRRAGVEEGEWVGKIKNGGRVRRAVRVGESGKSGECEGS